MKIGGALVRGLDMFRRWFRDRFHGSEEGYPVTLRRLLMAYIDEWNREHRGGRSTVWRWRIVSMHSYSEQACIRRTQQQVVDGSWKFDSSGFRSAEDCWLLVVAAPEDGKGPSLLIEVEDPFDLWLEKRIVGVHLRESDPPAWIWEQLAPPDLVVGEDRAERPITER